MSQELDELARRHGVSLWHYAPDGSHHDVPDATKRAILKGLGVACDTDEDIASGLEAAAGLSSPEMRVPEGIHCDLPGWLEHERAWGIACQVYELRSARNWGIGDFADLAVFCAIAGRTGADFVGINPMHALFMAEPAKCSPFFPSSRLFLNPIYIAVDHVPGYDPEFADKAEIERLRQTDLVDYVGVAAAKLAVLRAVWEAGQGKADAGSSKALVAFRVRGGTALLRHALFEALSFAMVEAGYGSGWTGWPVEWRDPEGEAVQRFAEANQDEIDFHVWLQFLAEIQLEAARQVARSSGMRIGLYLDLAVGDAPDGSATWSDPDLYAHGVSIGAPPDFFSAEGQNWALAPMSPRALRERDCEPYRAMVAASMRHAGALRIDHVMSLWQLFFVPAGESASEGAYVRYPIETLVTILAEECAKNGTVLIGEDLGYVPEGFRDLMAQAGILSYRILYFEEQDAGFKQPDGYPRLALACLSTHDLPPLKAWWRGDDIRLRRDHGLISEGMAQAQENDRRSRREALAYAMLFAGAIGEHEMPPNEDEMPDTVAISAHRFVAKTPSALACIRLADLTGEMVQTNLPGTVDSYPNWRPKNAVPLEELTQNELFQAITSAVAVERPRGV